MPARLSTATPKSRYEPVVGQTELMLDFLPTDEKLRWGVYFRIPLAQRLQRPAGWVSGVLCDCGQTRQPIPDPPGFEYVTAWAIRVEARDFDEELRHGGHRAMGAYFDRALACRVAEVNHIHLEFEEWTEDRKGGVK